MATESKEDLIKQLDEVTANIEAARRELKALRRHPAEGSKGKGKAVFISGKEQMAAAAEAEKRLDSLRQQEQEIRARLQTENPAVAPPSREAPDA
jgi:hypothetical protein